MNLDTVTFHETPIEKKWCWWTLAYESGYWVYTFSKKTNQVITKVFIWQWEEE